MGKISKNELNDSLKLEIENARTEIVNDFSSGVDKAASAELAKTLNTNQQTTNSQMAQKADKQQEDWINATLQNGWLADLQPSYFKDNFGFVTIRGSVRDGNLTSGTAIFTLPLGYRPNQRLEFIVKFTSANSVNSGFAMSTSTHTEVLHFSTIR